MVKYGYARVSTKGQAKNGNSLEEQINRLKEEGCTVIFQDSFTGTKTDRPEFNKLLSLLKESDTLVVTKLDRFARSLSQGGELVTELINKGVKVNILNIGVMDNTPSSKLIRNIFFSFAEFERDMIIERTSEGKAIAKINNPNFKEGRKPKLSDEVLDEALVYLESHTYAEAEKKYQVSKSTLIRHKRKRQAE